MAAQSKRGRTCPSALLPMLKPCNDAIHRAMLYSDLPQDLQSSVDHLSCATDNQKCPYVYHPQCTSLPGIHRLDFCQICAHTGIDRQLPSPSPILSDDVPKIPKAHDLFLSTQCKYNTSAHALQCHKQGMEWLYSPCTDQKGGFTWPLQALHKLIDGIIQL